MEIIEKLLKLEKGCGEWSANEGFKGHTGGLPSCGEQGMLCDECKIKIQCFKEVLAEVEKVIEELFNSEPYQNDLCSDINKELKQKLGINNE